MKRPNLHRTDKNLSAFWGEGITHNTVGSNNDVFVRCCDDHITYRPTGTLAMNLI